MKLPFPIASRAIQGNFDFLAGLLSTPSTWATLPTLQNGWTAFDSPQYCKDGLGYVQCRGEIIAGTVTIDTLLWTFPSGFWPVGVRAWCPVANFSDAGRAIYVETDGEVKLGYAITAGSVFNLNGLRFPTF